MKASKEHQLQDVFSSSWSEADRALMAEEEIVQRNPEESPMASLLSMKRSEKTFTKNVCEITTEIRAPSRSVEEKVFLHTHTHTHTHRPWTSG